MDWKSVFDIFWFFSSNSPFLFDCTCTSYKWQTSLKRKRRRCGGGVVIVIILLCCHLLHLWKKKTLSFHYKKGCRSAIDFVKKQGLINVPKTGIVLIPLDSLDNKEIKFYPAIPPAAKLLVTKVDHPLERMKLSWSAYPMKTFLWLQET